MKCVIDVKLAKWMSENEYFYIMHRFNENPFDKPNHDNWDFVEHANRQKWRTISVSIGVQDYDKEFLKMVQLKNYRIDYLTIDIAHGHSRAMKDMIRFVKELELRCYTSIYGGTTGVPLRYYPFIIAGNVATSEAVVDLENWGADSVKVGIAQGGACTTFGMTGFGTPMFTCVQHCAGSAKKPIVADGGIKTNGDFSKAIVAGATMVMAGSVFAACSNSPAETVVKQLRSGEVRPTTQIGSGVVTSTYEDRIIQKIYKLYYGSASHYNKHSNHHVEGTLIELECNGLTYEQKLIEIQESYQSAISYAGGKLSISTKWGIRK
jgi:GMP reductase